MPVGVHVAVVDPGVGTPRRPIAIRGRAVATCSSDPTTGSSIGPRNASVASSRRGSDEPDAVAPDVSTTFHGRDIFAPVAAHLANGVDLTKVGEPIRRRRARGARISRRHRTGWRSRHARYCSSMSFGNCRLAGEPRDLEAAIGRPLAGGRLSLRHGGTATEVPWCASFGVVAAGSSSPTRMPITPGLPWR